MSKWHFTEGAWEEPGMVYIDGTYYIVTSNKTGWTPNRNKVFYSSSLAGPWEGGYDVAPNSNDTYASQNSFELTIRGSETTTYLYLGDMNDAGKCSF